ncbi:Hypothetical protein CINCED_3A003360 [Cinara cedri]|uniref:Uncharacterized protein n=1 Tax=Cinara cedri TaxID=506608 RepID=A0A5E4MZD4_9HEMI|nr:Hypothetical protein CINCED_3A003360 [Cinara cedri]
MANVQSIAFALFIVSMASMIAVTKQLFAYDARVYIRYPEPAANLHKQWGQMFAGKFNVSDVDEFCRTAGYNLNNDRLCFCPNWLDMLISNMTDRVFLRSPSVSVAYISSWPKVAIQCCNQCCRLYDLYDFMCVKLPLEEIYKRYYN